MLVCWVRFWLRENAERTPRAQKLVLTFSLSLSVCFCRACPPTFVSGHTLRVKNKLQGVAREGTWVLWTADALSEPAEWSQSGDEGVGRGKTSGLRGKKTRLENEAVKGYDANGYDANGYDANGYDANGVHVEILPTWGTTFTWNVSHPPPLHPAAVWGGAGLGKGTAATTLFMVVSGETVVEAAAREAAYGGGGGGGVKEGGMRRELDGGGEGGEGGGGVRELWTLGVAPEVTFR